MTWRLIVALAVIPSAVKVWLDGEQAAGAVLLLLSWQIAQSAEGAS